MRTINVVLVVVLVAVGSIVFAPSAEAGPFNRNKGDAETSTSAEDKPVKRFFKNLGENLGQRLAPNLTDAIQAQGNERVDQVEYDQDGTVVHNQSAPEQTDGSMTVQSDATGVVFTIKSSGLYLPAGEDYSVTTNVKSNKTFTKEALNYNRHRRSQIESTAESVLHNLVMNKGYANREIAATNPESLITADLFVEALNLAEVKQLNGSNITEAYFNQMQSQVDAGFKKKGVTLTSPDLKQYTFNAVMLVYFEKELPIR